MNKNIFVSEINESDFEEKVIKESHNSLVIVDFWAPWCGPCKQLTPSLEKIINKANGKVKLIKINIDENKQIAGQLRVQSIPAVFAFKEGQPIDTFQGVIPEGKITEFIEKNLGEKIDTNYDDFYTNIKNLILEKNTLKAKELIANFLTKNPSDGKSCGLYIDCLIELKEYDEADNFITSIDKEVIKNADVKAAIKKLKIKKDNVNGPTIEELTKIHKREPNNIVIIINLADKYFAENEFDKALEILLSNFKKDKNKIKDKFINFFEALGNTHEKTVEYRKKLSSIMFS